MSFHYILFHFAQPYPCSRSSIQNREAELNQNLEYSLLLSIVKQLTVNLNVQLDFVSTLYLCNMNYQ